MVVSVFFLLLQEGAPGQSCTVVSFGDTPGSAEVELERRSHRRGQTTIPARHLAVVVNS
jgi:hypothetical protein